MREYPRRDRCLAIASNEGGEDDLVIVEPVIDEFLPTGLRCECGLEITRTALRATGEATVMTITCRCHRDVAVLHTGTRVFR